MNFQPIIDNLPMILVALGFLLWAAAKALEAYAKKDPAVNQWDARAEQMHMIADKYSQAIEWLVSSGFAKWSGAEKLAMLQAQMKTFQEQWDKGNYVDAIAQLSGFYTSAKAKVEKAASVVLPFAPRPSLVTNRTLSQAQGAIGPDSPAVEN